MKSSLLLVLSLFSFFLVQAQNNPDFYVAPNGVTCMCPNANFGDTGTLTINGQTNTFTKRSRVQLDALIEANQNDPQIALTCTSGITDMSEMFKFKNTFNQDISTWDISNVTNTSNMFFGADSFNKDINFWDVSNITNMAGMFRSAVVFNRNINGWDVSNVTNMSRMFYFSSNFNQPLNNWDVSSVTDMSFMFSNATDFNQDIGNWDVSNVKYMNSMFRASHTFNQNLNGWNIISVITIGGMFYDAFLFDQPLNNWNVSNLSSLISMFENCQSFNQPLNNWDVSNVTNMTSMFSGADLFNQSLDDWDVSNVTNMTSMFRSANSFNQPLNNWDVSNVSFMSLMFQSATQFNQPLDNWNVSNVNNMNNIFSGSNSFNQDLSDWNFNFSNSDSINIVSFSGLDPSNYDLLLDRFVQLNLSNKNIYSSSINYCDEFTRQQLITAGCTITDDGIADGCNLNYVFGSAIYDSNENGCTPDDFPFLNYLVNVNNGSENASYNLNSNGEYIIGLDSGNYNLSIINLNSNFISTPSTQTVNFSGQNEIITDIDFCVVGNQEFEDLSINIFPLDDAIPGFQSDYLIIVNNDGTQTVPSLQVSFEYDESFQTYVTSTAPLSNSSTDILNFQFTNLDPFSPEVFEITLQNIIPPTLNSGDILILSAEVTPDSNDLDIENNSARLDQTVVNSFDPNDKMVVQGDEIEIDDTDQYLDYRIRFQNLGTANALNVKITDTIDNNLDWTTFQPITSSHDYRIEIVDGEQINYYFDNINLPFETADPEGSNGYITYKIKPKPSVQIGNTFENTAYIYFDFNLPIITNTVVTTVMDNLDVDAFDFNRIKVYPNPVSDQLNIELPNNLNLNSIELFDIQGKLVKSFDYQTKFDFNDIQKGVYILKLNTDHGSYHHKLIKK